MTPRMTTNTHCIFCLSAIGVCCGDGSGGATPSAAVVVVVVNSTIPTKIIPNPMNHKEVKVSFHTMDPSRADVQKLAAVDKADPVILPCSSNPLTNVPNMRALHASMARNKRPRVVYSIQCGGMGCSSTLPCCAHATTNESGSNAHLPRQEAVAPKIPLNTLLLARLLTMMVMLYPHLLLS